MSAVASAPESPPTALYVDTCALLDIVRLPMRSKVPRAELVAIRDVLSAVRGSRVALYVSDIVPEEFTRNEANVVSEVQRHVRRVRDDAKAVRDSAHELGIGDISWNIDPSAISEMLQQHAQDVLATATVVATLDQDRLDAMDRHVKSLRPGRRGKDSLMDCTITTSMLRSVRGHGGGSIFLSSNVHDYSADEKSSVIHDDLRPAFDELNIKFVTTWSWAARMLAGPIRRHSAGG